MSKFDYLFDNNKKTEEKVKKTRGKGKAGSTELKARQKSLLKLESLKEVLTLSQKEMRFFF